MNITTEELAYDAWFEALMPGRTEVLATAEVDGDEDRFIRLVLLPRGSQTESGEETPTDVWVVDHYLSGQAFFPDRTSAESAFRASVENGIWCHGYNLPEDPRY